MSFHKNIALLCGEIRTLEAIITPYDVGCAVLPLIYSENSFGIWIKSSTLDHEIKEYWYSRCVQVGLTHNVAAKRHCQWWRVLLPDSWGVIGPFRYKGDIVIEVIRIVSFHLKERWVVTETRWLEGPLPRKSSIKSSYVAENGFIKRQLNRVLDRILGIPGKCHHNLTHKKPPNVVLQREEINQAGTWGGFCLLVRRTVKKETKSFSRDAWRYCWR